MDRFCASCPEILVPTQLHILGVQSMFIATKMEEVYPLKMKTVYEKIAHKKISVAELSEMENKIAQELDFCLVSSTVYDLAMTKIARHLTEIDSYSDSLMKEIEELCSCIGKFICYSYELVSSYDKEILALALANYTLEIYKLDRLNRPTALEQECREQIVDSITNFKRKYKGLNNLFKFTDRKILEIVEGPL